MSGTGIRRTRIIGMLVVLALSVSAVGGAETPSATIGAPAAASASAIPLEQLPEDDMRLPPDAEEPIVPEAAASGDIRIDALLSRYQWFIGTVTYSFYSDAVFGGSYYGPESGVREVSPQVKQSVRNIMAMYSSMLNLDLVEVAETSSTIGQIRIMQSPNAGYAYAYLPTTSAMFHVAGDIHLASSYDVSLDESGFQQPPGDHGYVALIHEIGHALGLKHPHDSPPTLPGEQDNDTNTVMSYTFSYSAPGTPMAYDVLALQYLYGARASRTGNDTYVFTRTDVDQYSLSGQVFLQPANQMKQLIWDGGGYNVLDFSSIQPAASGYRIDLRPLGWITTTTNYQTTSYVSGTTLGPGVRVQRVVNSSGNDTIYANAEANVFAGYSPDRTTGADTIIGADSADRVDLTSFAASQVIQRASGSDLVLDLGPSGSITVQNYYAGSHPDIALSGGTSLVSINDVRVTEGNSGTVPAVFTVSLLPPASAPVSVPYATVSGTATAGVDFVAASGTVIFAAGETQKTVTVSVIGDTLVEGDETFSVALGTPSAGAELNDASGEAIITDDDQTSTSGKPPVVVLGASDTSGTAPLTVNFSSNGTYDPDGTIDALVWDFGDGIKTSTPHPSHNFVKAGVFTVKLSVTDNSGNTVVKSVVITVTAVPLNQPPTAVVTASPTTGQAPLTVNFSSAGSSDPDGTLTVFDWRFGDGGSSSSASLTHVYSDAGTYSVSLMVTDNKGATSLASTTIVVLPPNVPPSVVIGLTPSSGYSPLTVRFSSEGSADSDGTISSISWVFGDGAVSSEANPTHLYVATGTFTVVLKVTDNQGASSERSATVTVAQGSGGTGGGSGGGTGGGAGGSTNKSPVAAATATPVSGTAPLLVAFSGSGSLDPDGAIISYGWTFGDGATSTSANPTHTYATVGTYVAKLTVTDNNGATGSYSILITVTSGGSTSNRSPLAAVTATPTSGSAPLPVTFSSRGSIDPDGVITSYAWTFGDGGTSNEVNPVHTYSSAGYHVATLTVTDNDGATGSYAVAINVTGDSSNQPPVAVLTASPTTGTVPLTVVFSSTGTNDADGTIASYSWSFGDGQSSSSPNPTHIYTTPGTFTATLTVTDNKGATAATSTTIVTSPVVTANATTIFVGGISMDVVPFSSAWMSRAVVTILDDTGRPVPSAVVTGRWYGLAPSAFVYAMTDENGRASFASPYVFQSGAFGFTVSYVAKAGLTYDPARNTETSHVVSFLKP